MTLTILGLQPRYKNVYNRRFSFFKLTVTALTLERLQEGYYGSKYLIAIGRGIQDIHICPPNIILL